MSNKETFFEPSTAALGTIYVIICLSIIGAIVAFG
jgi:hypothetical protein